MSTAHKKRSRSQAVPQAEVAKIVAETLVRAVTGVIQFVGKKTILDIGGLTIGVQLDESPKVLDEIAGKRITLTGQQAGDQIIHARVVDPVGTAANLPDGDLKTFAQIENTIRKEGDSLLKFPGVVSIRPGYRFKKGWITNDPCVVVSVLCKIPTKSLDKSSKLPEKLGKFDIDVTPATPLEQLQARFVPNSAGADIMAESLVGLALPTSTETVSPQRIIQSKYLPPSNLSLDSFTGAANILCHASPDAGWTTLSPFLSSVKENLTVAMYNFTAPHILDVLKSGLTQAKADLSLLLNPKESLDDGGGNPTKNPKSADIDQDVIRTDLIEALGKDFQFEWAAVKDTGKTTGGLFPSAYHIKVAVRDGESFWLSSGNWQSSNQPNIDPLNEHKSLPGLRTMYNREWHVIVEEPTLAKLYHDYIQYDFKQAAQFQADSSQAATADLPYPRLAQAPDESQAAVPDTFFAPKQFAFTAGKPITIQPLLTPDPGSYAQHALALIQSAKKTLYFQNQYIKIGKQNADEFTALISAIVQKMEDGVDVRIILRDIGNTREMLEALKANGFDMDKVRLQKACHNKGIIVDSQTVLLGSHNYSGDGVLYNRDASLIFFNADIAEYYEKIFLFDWTYLAKAKTSSETNMPQVITADTPMPANAVQIDWNSYFDGDDQERVDSIVSQSLSSQLSVAAPSIEVISSQSAVASSSFKIGKLNDLKQAKAEFSSRYLGVGDQAEYSAYSAVSAKPNYNVVGVGIGEKLSGTSPTGELALKFFVRSKLPEDYLSSADVLPKQVAGLDTDVEEVGDIVPQVTINPRSNLTPAQPGCSVGFAYPPAEGKVMAGTFGALVKDANGKVYILSNCHVLAQEGKLAAGAPIYQAGLLDVVAPAVPRQIAKLTKFIPFGAGDLQIDAALAELLDPSFAVPDIIQIGAPLGIKAAARDMAVEKFGRTTFYQSGTIISTSSDFKIGYETGTYKFVDQIVIRGVQGTTFSGAGDSGSLIVERQSRMAVGLLIGGSPSHTIANHLDVVLNALHVTLL